MNKASDQSYQNSSVNNYHAEQKKILFNFSHSVKLTPPSFCGVRDSYVFIFKFYFFGKLWNSALRNLPLGAYEMLKFYLFFLNNGIGMYQGNINRGI